MADARKAEVDAVLLVRTRYTIDLDSGGYSEFDTLEQAMKFDQESLEQDAHAFLEMDGVTASMSVTLAPK